MSEAFRMVELHFNEDISEIGMHRMSQICSRMLQRANHHLIQDIGDWNASNVEVSLRLDLFILPLISIRILDTGIHRIGYNYESHTFNGAYSLSIRTSGTGMIHLPMLQVCTRCIYNRRCKLQS